jgi:hypothetical protein
MPVDNNKGCMKTCGLLENHKLQGMPHCNFHARNHLHKTTSYIWYHNTKKHFSWLITVNLSSRIWYLCVKINCEPLSGRRAGWSHESSETSGHSSIHPYPWVPTNLQDQMSRRLTMSSATLASTNETQN